MSGSIYSPNTLGLLQGVLNVRYAASAVCAIVSWEHILHLAHEFRILRRGWAEGQLKFSDVIFLLARYALVWYIVTGMIYIFGRPADCLAIEANLVTAFLIGSGAINLLFMYRVWILWARAWWPAVLIGVVYLADLGLWITFAAKTRVANVGHLVPAPGPSCIILTDTKNEYNVKGFNWLFRFILDSLACVLTLWRLSTLPKLKSATGPGVGRTGRGGRSTVDMRTWIRFSNLIYFATTSLIYLAGFIGKRFDKRLESAIIWAMIAQVLPVLVGIRIIVHTPSLRQQEAERKRLEGAAHYVAGSAETGHGQGGSQGGGGAGGHELSHSSSTTPAQRSRGSTPRQSTLGQFHPRNRELDDAGLEEKNLATAAAQQGDAHLLHLHRSTDSGNSSLAPSLLMEMARKTPFLPTRVHGRPSLPDTLVGSTSSTSYSLPSSPGLHQITTPDLRKGGDEASSSFSHSRHGTTTPAVAAVEDSDGSWWEVTVPPSSDIEALAPVRRPLSHPSPGAPR